MAHYFISGVWKQSGIITDVYVHPYDPTSNTFSPGSKVSEAVVIQSIRGGNIYQTLNWNYSAVSWRKGAIVMIVREGNKDYLRTGKDATIENNLDNLINLQGFL